MLSTNCRTYKSVDVVMDPSQAVLYPAEFLNSLEPTGIPPHNLQLKIGVPIMLLRNLDPPEMCNGTRLSVKNPYSHIIEATILTGCARGTGVFIPRIPLIPTDLPFHFKRLQFPVRLAFAMSINKAQGQSLKIAGIHLENQCFSHGQLYVACSRVGNPTNLYILAHEGKTKNTVYHCCLFQLMHLYTLKHQLTLTFNPLNHELNPICYLLALLGAHHFLHVSRIRVKSLTLRVLMSYIYTYGAPILDVSRSHTTTQHSR